MRGGDLGILGGLGALSQGYEEGRQDVGKRLYQQALIEQMRRKALQEQQADQGYGLGFQALRQGGLEGMGQQPGMEMPQPQGQPMAQQQGPVNLFSGPPSAQMSRGQPLLDPQRQLQPQPGGGYVARGSWFGNQPGWNDPMSGPNTASGRPLSEPGIALPTRSTLGQQFDVTGPGGQTMRLPQTDVGPAAWTGRGVDVNSAAAQRMGYTPSNFPTDQQFTVAPVVQAQRTAQAVGQQIPQQALGRVTISQLANAIERANPGAPDGVKAHALLYLNKVMAPEERADLQVLIQQMRGESQLGAANIRAATAEAGQAQQQQQFGQRLEQQKALGDIRQAQGEGRERIAQERLDLQREQGAARLENQQAAQTQRQQKAIAKPQAQMEELENVANAADELKAMIKQNPKLVGIKGMIGHGVGAVGETLLGIPEDPDVAAFSNRMSLFQRRLQDSLLNSRYYSAQAQASLDKIVPGLSRFDNPSKAIAGLEDVSRTLRSEAGVQKRIIEGLGGKGASVDIGGGTPGASAAPAAPSGGSGGYASPADVYKAFDAGKITKDQAKDVLIKQFGYTSQQ